MAKSVHAAIISWHGHHGKAHAIARELDGCVQRLSVVYSNQSGQREDGPGNWIGIDDHSFFGPKFKEVLMAHGDEDFLLQIQADASHGSWHDLVGALKRAADTRPRLGVWAPNIDSCFWTERNTLIAPVPNTALHHVTHTDAIAWALSRDVVWRMHELDYEANNLGWGIDTLANCYAASRGFDVLRDLSVTVCHDKGSGYDHDPARQQMNAFLQQMDDREEAFYQLFKAHFRAHNKLPKPRSLRKRWRNFWQGG
ncbi:hypothetical protein [Alkalilacustris brevis]|uniref:hypothetical protein n=1 Tax=Alkalilacustris brevis TaxID=2026338 RepID=UPI000E0D622E|nr:hypothetical protein [Alkalilacustris brevis]